MKRSSSILLFLSASAALAADDLPKPLNFARYETMLERSPFAVATAVAAPSATPNFAKDLYIANAAHSPNGDLVTVASSSDKNFKKYLTTKEPVDGYQIVPPIEWSDRVGATKVTISKDGQTATLSFNQALLTQPLPAGPQAPPQGAPAVTNGNALPSGVMTPAPIPMLPKPAATAGLPTPPPHVRPVIPRNPVSSMATPAPAAAAGATPELRR